VAGKTDKAEKGRKMKIKLTFTEGLLGTASANPEVHAEFIASKSADADKAKEEARAIHAEELMEKSTTVFPRNADGAAMLWDYQIKGFLKEAVGVLLDFQEPDMKVGKAKLSRWTFKKIVDNAVFVTPRAIPLQVPEGCELSRCTRPLRADTMKGERVALATSEEAPRGTVIEFEITTLAPAMDGLIRKCLDYGALKGVGQWRNSGKGRFVWEEVK
jgi:hypothetical protein